MTGEAAEAILARNGLSLPLYAVQNMALDISELQLNHGRTDNVVLLCAPDVIEATFICLQDPHQPAELREAFESFAIRHPATPPELLEFFRRNSNKLSVNDYEFMVHPRASRQMISDITDYWLAGHRRTVTITVLHNAIPAMLANPNVDGQIAEQWIDYAVEMLNSGTMPGRAIDMLRQMADPQWPNRDKIPPAVLSRVLVILASSSA